MSDKIFTCEEGVEIFKKKSVMLPKPAPFNTSLSSEPKFTGLDGATPTFVTKKLEMPKYPISLAEMPSKTTFPAQPSAKLNVPVNTDKSLSDLCKAAQDFFIEKIEEDKVNVSFCQNFASLFLS
jgi:hypothetical protein